MLAVQCALDIVSIVSIADQIIPSDRRERGGHTNYVHKEAMYALCQTLCIVRRKKIE